MPQIRASHEADGSESEKPGFTDEMRLNALKASAAQNLSEFTVPMWALIADEPLAQHRPATGLENNFFLKIDGSKVPNNIKESVIGADQRRKVDPVDFAPGGKYRPVAKLSLVFNKNGGDFKMMGTGWMIQDDILITAGHCVYDTAYGMGQVKSIVVYLGYQGAKSIAPGQHASTVEVARGKVVATTSGWIRGLGPGYDIAWVKLDTKFRQMGKDNKPIDWTKTPFQAINAMLGVVGYPGDKQLDGEYGAEMYQCWMPTDYDLGKAGMIQYEIDSYGGQSGSPVFYSLNPANIDANTNAPYQHVKDLAANSIGVHAYGGAISSGTALGPFGIPIMRYLNVMAQNVRLTKEIRFVPEDPPRK